MTNYALLVDPLHDTSETEDLEGSLYDVLKDWALTDYHQGWYQDDPSKTGILRFSIGTYPAFDDAGEIRNALALLRAHWSANVVLASGANILVGIPLDMSNWTSREGYGHWSWNIEGVPRPPLEMIGIPDADSALFNPLKVAPRHLVAINRYVELTAVNIPHIAALRRQILVLMDLVNRYGHKPVLVFEEDEGSLELEVRINPDELLMVSILSDGTIDGTIHSANSGYAAVPEKTMSDLLGSLQVPNRVTQATSR